MYVSMHVGSRSGEEKRREKRDPHYIHTVHPVTGIAFERERKSAADQTKLYGVMG